MATRHVTSANGTPFRASLDMAEARPHSLHPVRQPPLAHTRAASASSRAYTQHKQRLQSSASSAGSGSSTLSSHSPRSPKHTQWPSPMAQHANIQRHSPTVPPQHLHHHHQPSPSRSQPSSHPPEMVERSAPSVTYVQHEPEYEEDENEHGIWILAYLSLLSPLHALTTSLITFLISITLILLSPFRLCATTQAPLGDALIRALAPFHRQHLQMIYAPSVDNAYSFEFSATKLVLVLLASPVLSLGVMVAAWVSGAFWVFATIMGNPDGTERRDDGQDAVLTVRGWWERWFLKALTTPGKGDERIGSIA